MTIHELDLSVGDVVEIDGYVLTVMDIENEEVTLRLDEPTGPEEPNADGTTSKPR